VKEARPVSLSIAILLVLTALILGGCSGPSSTAEPVPTPLPARGEMLPLDESRWELQSLRGAGLVPETAVTIRFVNSNEIAGAVDCNSYATTYEAGGAVGFRLTSRVHFTQFDCSRPPTGVSQEGGYYEALAAAGGYGVQRPAGQPAILTLYDAAGAALLTFHERQAPELDPALAGDWLLETIDGSRTLPGTQLRLSIDSDRYDVRIDGYAGCNLYGGTLRSASGGSFQAEEVFYNARACEEPPGVMIQEQAYGEALQAVTSYTLADDTLTLFAAGDEARLVFTRDEGAVADPGALPGTTWRLTSAFGETPAAETVLIFLDEALGLARYDGCAGYLFSYQAGGESGVNDDLTIFGAQALPNDGCPDPGQALAYVLPDGYVHSFRVDESGLSLLFENSRELLYEPLDAGELLEGGEWVLLAFVTVAELDILVPRVTSPQPDLPPRLRFEAGTLRGNAGCNDYLAPYEIPAGTSELVVGEMVATEMVCEAPAELMAQERNYLSALANASRTFVAADLLWLQTGESSALLFARDLNDAAAGETSTEPDE
jgi:heat shock protein HslJ